MSLRSSKLSNTYISIGQSELIAFETEIDNDGIAGQSSLTAIINLSNPSASTGKYEGQFYAVVNSIGEPDSTDFYIPNPV